MIREIEFQQAYDKALEMLLGMQQNLEDYQSQHTYNEDYVEAREKEVIRIARLMEASARCIRELKRETAVHYQSGFEKGKQWSPYQKHEYRRPDYSIFDVLVMLKLDRPLMVELAKRIKRKEGEEVLRQLSIARSKLNWPELY